MVRRSVFVIAEAGVNHNGNKFTAHRLVDAAADAGADAIKFQTFTAEKLATKIAPKAEYQKKDSERDETQFQMLKRMELDRDAHFELLAHAKMRGIKFLSSPFDQESLYFLSNEMGLDTIKIPSGEITNGPLLLAAARTRRDIILSTGMSTMDEINQALSIIAFGFSDLETNPSLEAFSDAMSKEKPRKLMQKKVTILQCTSAYPCPENEVNLGVISTLKSNFSLNVGFSDHTTGIYAAIAAAALGASVIEKHFTLDRSSPGPDHKASLTPRELRQMIEAIRCVEQNIGTDCKHPTKSEIANRDTVRKSLVALTSISEGEKFSASNLGVKRPGTGLSPVSYWDQIGRRSNTKILQDQLITE